MFTSHENEASKVNDLVNSLDKLYKLAKDHPGVFNIDTIRKSMDQANKLLESANKKYKFSENDFDNTDVDIKSNYSFLKTSSGD